MNYTGRNPNFFQLFVKHLSGLKACVGGGVGWWQRKKSEGAWDSGSRGEGSAGVKAWAMGLWLWGQMGVWNLGRVPGWLKALGWLTMHLMGERGTKWMMEVQKVELGTGGFPKTNQKIWYSNKLLFSKKLWTLWASCWVKTVLMQSSAKPPLQLNYSRPHTQSCA